MRESMIRVVGVLASTIQHTFNSISIDRSEIWNRVWEALSVNWHLGFTAFGSPPVHFQIVRSPRAVAACF